MTFKPMMQEAQWLRMDLDAMLHDLVGEREKYMHAASLTPAVLHEKRLWKPGEPLDVLLGIDADDLVGPIRPMVAQEFRDLPLGMVAMLELEPYMGPAYVEAWASERTWDTLGVDVSWFGWFITQPHD